jgi:hypothetical protein
MKKASRREAANFDAPAGFRPLPISSGQLTAKDAGTRLSDGLNISQLSGRCTLGAALEVKCMPEKGSAVSSTALS